MSSNEANELKIIVEMLRQMIDMLLVLGKECLCNQCIVSADGLREQAAQKLSLDILFLCLRTI